MTHQTRQQHGQLQLPPAAVKIPADVEREDRLLAGLTARQLVILTVAAACLYGMWLATRDRIPVEVFVAAAAPFAAITATVALGRRDGISLDRWLAAAIRQRLAPRRRIDAPEGTAPLPEWIADGLAAATGTPASRLDGPRTAPLDAALPATGVGEAGVVELDDDGIALVGAVGPVDFALRSPAEQEDLAGTFGRYLHALGGPAQILIRTHRIDLSGRIDALRDQAQRLPAALADAADEHAVFLTELGRRPDLWTRQLLLVLREPSAGAGTDRRTAETRLLRRLDEATALLAPAGITIRPLDAEQASAVVTAATNPASLLPSGARLTPPDALVATTFALDDAVDTRAGKGRGGFGPASLEVGPRHLVADGHAMATFAVTGFPREVRPGWLQPLLTYPGRLDVALHVEPVDPVVAAARLKKQLGRLESGRRHGAEHGRLPDPDAEVATEDAYDLSARVARSEAKLFRVGLYLTVHADSEQELAGEVAAVRALAASLLLDVKPATWRSLQGWITCLPFGLDLLRQRRTFDTAALAAAFPFASADLPPADPADPNGDSAGVLHGHNLGSQSLVVWDRFGMDNHNAVILGRSGAGKSYLVKLDTLRHLYQGVQAFVIDPEDEYRRLAQAVDGDYVHLGAPGVRINPFDLPLYAAADGQINAPADALVRRSLFCQTVIATMLGTDLSATRRAILDAAIAATYHGAGITADPSTWTRPAPLLSDLAAQLHESQHAEARDLAAHLHPFVEGAHAGLFDGPTTTRPNGHGHLVVYSLRDLPDELKPLGSLLVLDAIWTQVANPSDRRPRLVVVDEAWLLMQDPAGARFLFRAAKALRKHWAGLTVATQDVADVLGTDLGKAVVSNAATQILLRQAPQAVDDITDAFNLSDGERQFLLSAERGCGLISDGTRRVAFQAAASQTEHDLVTTSPEHLTSLDTEPSAAVVDINPQAGRDHAGGESNSWEVGRDAA